MGQSYYRKVAGLLTPVLRTPGCISGLAARAAAASHTRDAFLHRNSPRTTRLTLQCRFHAHGMTLIELMVTLTVLGILAAAAIPNFKSFLHNTRLSSEATKLYMDMETARSEAARRNTTVTICPMPSGNACSNDWSKPRVMFVDADNDGTRGASEELIRNSDALSPTVTVTTANLSATPNAVRIRPVGVSSTPTASWKFCERDSTLPGQTVSMSGSGRPYTELQSICP
jgi:type IV fimbrial biogenesis protein FimT